MNRTLLLLRNKHTSLLMFFRSWPLHSSYLAAVFTNIYFSKLLAIINFVLTRSLQYDWMWKKRKDLKPLTFSTEMWIPKIHGCLCRTIPVGLNSQQWKKVSQFVYGFKSWLWLVHSRTISVSHSSLICTVFWVLQPSLCETGGTGFLRYLCILLH